MRQHYTTIMDDGKVLYEEAESAGNAIMKALKAHRGHRVKECYLGDSMGIAGRVKFEVPAHEPLGKHRPKKRVKEPATLFDDQFILTASQQAKSKESST